MLPTQFSFALLIQLEFGFRKLILRLTAQVYFVTSIIPAAWENPWGVATCFSRRLFHNNVFVILTVQIFKHTFLFAFHKIGWIHRFHYIWDLEIIILLCQPLIPLLIIITISVVRILSLAYAHINVWGHNQRCLGFFCSVHVHIEFEMLSGCVLCLTHWFLLRGGFVFGLREGYGFFLPEHAWAACHVIVVVVEAIIVFESKFFVEFLRSACCYFIFLGQIVVQFALLRCWFSILLKSLWRSRSL